MSKINDFRSAFIPIGLLKLSGDDFLDKVLADIEALRGTYNHSEGQVGLGIETYTDPTGQVSIREETYRFLRQLHDFDFQTKELRIFYAQDSKDRFAKERDLWDKLMDSRRNGQRWKIVLTGPGGIKFPTHPYLGALYTGDEITLVNDAILIFRKSPRSNKLHGGEETFGFYLLSVYECFHRGEAARKLAQANGDMDSLIGKN